VLLGNGDGTFQAAVSYSSGGQNAYSVAVADVNGDGKPDLVVANECYSGDCPGVGGGVSVLLGNGDGTFQGAVSYNSGAYEAISVAVADVNGDGKPDLLVANECTSLSFPNNNCEGDGEVGVLLGNGDGTFQAAVSYSSGGQNAYSVAVADVNGDGKPDLVVATECYNSSNCSNGGVDVLLGNGDGTFQAAVSYSSGGYFSSYSVAVADVNGDGKPDLVVANECYSSDCPGAGGVSVLLGNGDGTFQGAVSYNSGGEYAYSVAVADVNGDGKPDLVVTNYNAVIGNYYDGGVGVLLGNGDGTFQPAAMYGSDGEYAFSVAVADVNGDGKPDLVVATECYNSSNCSNGGVDVLLGNGDGTFRGAPIHGSGGYEAYSVAVADVNGDGKPDLLVANYCASSSNCSNGEVGVLLGNGNGAFQPAVSYNSGGEYAYSIAVADVNGDGKPDLLVANFYDAGNPDSGGVSVLLGNGNGTFQAAVSNISGGFGAYSIAVADVNGDGKPDLVVANECYNSSNCSNGGVDVLLGNGDGTFQSAVSYSSSGEIAYSVAIADVNGDGKPDIVVANQCYSSADCSNGGVDVLLGNGDGTFQPAVTYSSGAYRAYSIAVADVNGDGKPDIVVSNACSNAQCPIPSYGSVAVLLGNGDGTFQPALTTSTPGGLGFGQIAVADFNDDGKLDVAIGSGGVLLFGNGDGTFQTPLALGAHGSATAKGDFNGDGIPDLAVGGVTILLGIIPIAQPSTTMLTSSQGTSSYGQSVTFTATVTGASGTPAGSVTFADGATTLGTVPLVSGSASLSTSALAPGSQTITATYGRSPYFLSSSATVMQTVNVASQTITVTFVPASADKDGPSFTVQAAGGGSGNPLVFTSSGNCTNVDATYYMGTKSTSCSVIINQAGNTDYTAAPQVTATVNEAALKAPVASFTGTSPEKYGSTFTVTATSDETQPGTSYPVISYMSGPCLLNSVSTLGVTVTGSVTMTSGTGSCKLSAAWAENFMYAAKTETLTIAAKEITPTVSFTGAPATAGVRSNFTVTATSNDIGNVPAITATPATKCTATAASYVSPGVYSSTVTIIANGACTMKSHWDADSDSSAISAPNQTTN
jgi:hypothetical protein